ncbi:HEAT repeat domain-containing protein [Candidatus Parcubacteria bacterium]|nr:HEAT repeat domain-containing protein [Candidatus Parcubacteria bacterium]
MNESKDKIEKEIKKIELLATMTGGDRDIVLGEYKNTISVKDVDKILSSMFTISLTEALSNSDSGVKRLVLSEIEQRDLNPEQEEVIIHILKKSECFRVRRAAARALKIDRKDAVKAFIHVLKKDKDAGVKRTAANKLVKVTTEDTKNVRKALIKALKDKDESVQEEITCLFEKYSLSNREIDKALIKEATKGKNPVSMYALNAIKARMKHWTDKELLLQLDGGSVIAEKAFYVVRHRMYELSVEELQVKLNSAHPKIVEIAAEILSRRKEEGKDILRAELGL